MTDYPFCQQPAGSKFCGACCLHMVASFYGLKYSLESLVSLTSTGDNGTTLKDIKEAAKEIGLAAEGYNLSYDEFFKSKAVPSIIPWGSQHFVVSYSVSKRHVVIADPGVGITRIPRQEFIRWWVYSKFSNSESTGVILLIEGKH